MVLSSSSSTSGTSNLDPSWVALIDNTITVEKQQRLDRLQQDSDDLDVRKAIYTDLKDQLSAFKTSLGKLWSTDGSYILNDARSVKVATPSVTGATVFSATATSTAALGNYTISVENLATQHRVVSKTVPSSTTALNYSGAFSITLGEKSTSISVDTGDTLYSIASKINSATYDSGKGVSASVVDNKLVIESDSSGSDYKMSFTGAPLVSLGIIDDANTIVPANQLQDGENASFTVNGLSGITRSSNTGISDVINGVTLNLAADAEGKSAVLAVESDTTAMKSALQSFVDKYNALQTYLANKTGYTKVDDKHYTAGALANDFSITSLKSDLVDQISYSAGSGAVKFFSDMGLTLDDTNKLSISDSTKLDETLKNHLEDVKSFLDTKMTRLDSIMSGYVGPSNSLVTYSLQSMEQQKTSLTNSIADENTRLNERRQGLIAYYNTLNDQITQLLYTQQSMSSYLTKIINGTS